MNHRGSDEIAMAHASQLLKNILNVGNGVQTNSKDMTLQSSMAEDLTVENACSYEAVGDKVEYQEITFGTQEDEQTFKINGQEVVIRTNPEQLSSSSNRVKIQNVVDFGWEQKYHIGHLVASHVSGQFIAFALKAHKTGSGVVRVLKTKTNQRELLKGMRGQVKDLAFAHSQQAVVLAAIDEYGTLLIYDIVYKDNALQCTLLLHVQRSDITSSDHHLVYWCSYIPEDNEDLDPDSIDISNLLSVVHNKEVEILNVSLVAKKYGPGPIYSKDVPSGLSRIYEHSEMITAAVFAPDGTALATACLDGEVKFFEMRRNKEEDMHRCLHQWKPHGGKPISCLVFLDNCKFPDPDIMFWKFALTGTDFNQELKLWCCESWDCLQTIQFKPLSNDSHLPCMKVELDSSAGYLILSDINSKVIYVLQIYQDISHRNAGVCSIAQFSLTQPVLSLTIVDAIKCHIKPLTGEVEPHETNENERNGERDCKDSDDKSHGISIKLWWINTKSLQESHITYHPPVMLSHHSDETLSIHSQDSMVYRDRLSDLSQELLIDQEPINKSFLEVDLTTRRDATSTPVANNNNNNNNNSSTHSVGVGNTFNSSFRSNSSGTTVGEVLLTPDDFASPSRHLSNLRVSPTTLGPAANHPESPPDDANFKTQTLPALVGSELKLMSFTPDSEPPLATSEVGGTNSVLPPVRRKSSQVSSTSSPSQEVADILAPAKSENLEDGRSSCSPKLVSPSAVSASTFLPPHANHLNQTVVVEKKKSSPLSSWPPVPDIKGYKMPSSHPPEVNHVPLTYVNLSSVACNTTPVKYVNDETLLTLQKVYDSLGTLNSSVSSLSSTVSSQAAELQRLEEALSRLQSDRKQDGRSHAAAQQDIVSRIDRMDSTFPVTIEKLTSQQSLVTQKKVESLLTKQWESERKLLEKEAVQISQAATNAATSKLAEHVHSQVKIAIVPEVNRFLEAFRLQVQQEHNKSILSSEAILKDCLSKLVKSKMFMDNLSGNVSISLQPQVQQVCRDVLQTHLLPTVEKFCQNLFLQLNESFKNGTRDYLSQAERFLENASQKQSKALTEQLQRDLKEQTENILSTNQQHINQLRENVDKTIMGALQSLGDGLVLRFRSMVSEEVRGALETVSQQVLMATPALSLNDSRAVTPAPKIDPIIMRNKINQLLQSELYNDAFQMALRATDISLVNQTIEQVHPSKLFGNTSTALKLPVVLSLLNQLGSSLDNNTKLKLEYLELALMSIEAADDPSSRNNQQQVLLPLREKLIILFQQLQPLDQVLSRKVRMLKMCIESILRDLEE